MKERERESALASEHKQKKEREEKRGMAFVGCCEMDSFQASLKVWEREGCFFFFTVLEKLRCGGHRDPIIHTAFETGALVSFHLSNFSPIELGFPGSKIKWLPPISCRAVELLLLLLEL